MSGVPVVFARNGNGFPVRAVPRGAPLLTVAENGDGAPIVMSERGAPFIVDGWTPDGLFTMGQPGYWAGLYDPAAGRLFQDAAGTTPTTTFDQPVGRSNRRAGTVDAAQATAGARPTLARWPRGGRRNMATGSALVAPSTFWTSGLTVMGITVAKAAFGVEDGMEYVDYDVTGTASGNSFISLFAFEQSRTPAASGQTWMASLYARRISGTAPPANCGVRAEVIEETAPATSNGSTNGTVICPDVDGITEAIRLFSVPATNQARPTITIRTETGATVNYRLRVKGLQFERAAARTAYQSCFSANDVTEAGQPDIWHLWNDGNDALPITLPAGTYGRARVDVLGVVTIDTVVNPTETLLTERQADVILRLGAFTTTEQNLIRDYWRWIAPDFAFQTIDMTAGAEGQWVGYSDGGSGRPQPAFGSIDAQPTTVTTLLAFYDDTASGVFLAVFAGDYAAQLVDLEVSIGGFVQPSFEVELISGNTWVRFTGLPGDLTGGEVYEVLFGWDLPG